MTTIIEGCKRLHPVDRSAKIGNGICDFKLLRILIKMVKKLLFM